MKSVKALRVFEGMNAWYEAVMFVVSVTSGRQNTRKLTPSEKCRFHTDRDKSIKSLLSPKWCLMASLQRYENLENFELSPKTSPGRMTSIFIFNKHKFHTFRQRIGKSTNFA